MVNLMPFWLPLLVSMLQGPGWVRVSAQESDPCVNYTELRDPWRSTTNTDRSQVRCDQNIVLGWYLLVDGNASVLMPNSCVPKFRCGTNVTIWLNGAHPTPAEGEVSRPLCGHESDGCCQRTGNIQVKACPGGYTVYRFFPTFCPLAFCADLSSRGALPAQTPPTQTPAPTTANLSSRGALLTQTPPTQTPAPATANHVVGMRLKVSSAERLNETEVEEQILKPFREHLRQQGINVTGIRLRSFSEVQP